MLSSPLGIAFGAGLDWTDNTDLPTELVRPSPWWKLPLQSELPRPAWCSIRDPFHRSGSYLFSRNFLEQLTDSGPLPPRRELPFRTGPRRSVDRCGPFQPSNHWPTNHPPFFSGPLNFYYKIFGLCLYTKFFGSQLFWNRPFFFIGFFGLVWLWDFGGFLR